MLEDFRVKSCCEDFIFVCAYVEELMVEMCEKWT